MPDVLTDRLLSERAGHVAAAQQIQQTAADEGRDLNETERTTLTNKRSRITEVDAQLALTTTDWSLNAETAANLSRYGGAIVQADPETQWRSAGHALWDYMHANSESESKRRVQAFARRSGGGDVFLAPGWEAQRAVQMQTRAAEHMGTTAANTTPTAGGFGGLLVNPVIGPIIQLAWTTTPLVNALGTRPSPNGWGFQRPRIVDPDLYTASQPQVKEKAELSSKKFDVVADAVTLTTVGNYLNLSLQAEQFINSPDALDIVVAQLNARTSVGIEIAAVGILESATKLITLAAGADAAATITAIYEAAAWVLRSTGQLPSYVACGPDGWARLGALTDLAGRPIFPSIGPVNASGQLNPGSLAGGISGLGQLVVTPGISDDAFYVGNSIGVELYKFDFPMLQAVEPSLLGKQIAVASALGSYQPPTTEAGPGGTPAAKYEAIVRIAAA